MASGGREYTLVGFSDELDRRPLIFVEALPSAKVCSACGLVPNAIAFLPCGHSFCKPCYEQCEHSGRITCPLDGDTCSGEEVAWINHPARSILTKQVLCWNHTNGCKAVTAAASISRHFHHECAHHSAMCPKCAAEILASDLCAHLESHCDASRLPTAAAVQPSISVPQEEALSPTFSEVCNGFQRIHNVVSMAISAIQGELKKITTSVKIVPTDRAPRHGETGERNLETRTIEKSLGQVRTETAKLKDQLEEFTQNVYANQETFHNRFVEKNEALKQSLSDILQSRIDNCDLAAQFAAFTEAMADGQRETKAIIERISLAIDRQYDRMSELLRNASDRQETRTQIAREGAEAHTHSLTQDASKIAWAKRSPVEDRQNALFLLPSAVPAATAHTFTIGNYEELKKCAELRRFPATVLEPVYLRGYCVSAGIRFFSTNEFFFLFDLYEGKADRHLQWPFNFQIRWSILHPKGTEKLEYCITPSAAQHLKDSFARPQDASDTSARASSIRFTTALLERYGFIKDRRILLRLTLEDPTTGEEP